MLALLLAVSLGIQDETEIGEWVQVPTSGPYIQWESRWTMTVRGIGDTEIEAEADANRRWQNRIQEIMDESRRRLESRGYFVWPQSQAYYVTERTRRVASEDPPRIEYSGRGTLSAIGY